MGTWSSKFNKITQSAVSKSKELAEMTRINMEISSTEQKLQSAYTELGESVAENNLLMGEASVAELLEQNASYKNHVNELKERLNIVRNINICPNCGAEVSRSSRFCDSCGTQMNRTVLQSVCPKCGATVSGGWNFCDSCGAPLAQPEAPVENVNHQEQRNLCPACGHPLEPDTAFCGNCGAKIL